jgi:hypothetical protein
MSIPSYFPENGVESGQRAPIDGIGRELHDVFGVSFHENPKPIVGARTEKLLKKKQGA